jgi:cytochrome c
MKIETPSWVSHPWHGARNKFREICSICSEAEGTGKQKDIQTNKQTKTTSVALVSKRTIPIE